MVVIETARLRLRPFRESDLDSYAALCGDPEVMRHIGRTLDRADTWRAIATNLGHWQMRGYGLWAWEEKETGRFVGRGGLWNPEGWPGIEAGWMLSKPFWGKGYATEAGKAAIEWGFEKLGVKHIVSLIQPDNRRSIHVAERLGETLERQIVIDGVKAYVYGIRSR